jgi:hypothetical protein
MSSYLLNTINLFDVTSTKPETTQKSDAKKKTVTTIYTINDTISPHINTYNITKENYDVKYNHNIIESNINTIIIKENNNYNKDLFNSYINHIVSFTQNDMLKIKEYYNNIFGNNELVNIDYIKSNMKNNILFSMYNIDNYKEKIGDDKENFFRNYIFKTQPLATPPATPPVITVNFNEFLLKGDLDNTKMDFAKYKIYDSYIDNIIRDFINDLIILNKNVPNYDKITDSNKRKEYETTIINAFSFLKSKLKGSLDTMINDFTNLDKNSNNILFNNIKDNYKRANNEEKVELKAYDISTKFTNEVPIDNNSKNFDNYSIKQIKDDKSDIDLLKGHDDIVKNANFVINERLYVLISTYIISLFIAYKLVKN